MMDSLFIVRPDLLTINLGALLNRQGGLPPAQTQTTILSLFSVFDIKQVFVSNHKLYDKSYEVAFSWLWLVHRI